MENPTDRTKKAFDFIYSELPHCEDMLKYLDSTDASNSVTHRIGDNTVDIDVTSYKIRLGKYLSNADPKKTNGVVYHTVDADPIKGSTFTHRRNSRSVNSSRQLQNKPAFKQLTKVNCSDIFEENDQEDSRMSSNKSILEIKQEINDGKCTNYHSLTKSSNYLVKSPAYYKRAAAESKVKNSVLNCFTIKAQCILKDLKRQRKYKAQSCSTTRNSINTLRLPHTKQVSQLPDTPFSL